jgi:nucleoside-diphosphate-sugar epimerase
MLSRFMEAAYAHKSLCVHGKSIARREFIYVKDVANAICWSIDNSNTCNQIINLGYGKGYTNYEIASLTNEAFHNPEKIFYEDQISEGIKDSYMNVTKLKKIGFTPEYSIETAMYDLFNEYCAIRSNEEQ